MKLDENLNYIISDDCKKCVHYQEFNSGPSCINGIPDEKCRHHKRKLCSHCSYSRVNEGYHLLFCKLWECFIEEQDYCNVCKSFNITS